MCMVIRQKNMVLGKTEEHKNMGIDCEGKTGEHENMGIACDGKTGEQKNMGIACGIRQENRRTCSLVEG